MLLARSAAAGLYGHGIAGRSARKAIWVLMTFDPGERRKRTRALIQKRFNHFSGIFAIATQKDRFPGRTRRHICRAAMTITSRISAENNPG